MSNKTQNIAKKYATAFLEYIIQKDEKKPINKPSLDAFEQLYKLDFFETNSKKNINLPFIETITEELRFISYYLTQMPNIMQFLKDSGYSSSKKLDLIYEALPNLDPITKAFLRILGEKNYLYLLPDIISEYNRLYHEFLGIKYITIVFSNLPKKKQINEIIKRIYKKFSPTVLATRYVYDETILGGLILYSRLRKLDFSLQDRLKRLIRLI